MALSVCPKRARILARLLWASAFCGLDLQCLFEMFDGRGRLFLLGQHVAEVDVRRDVAGLDVQALLEVVGGCFGRKFPRWPAWHRPRRSGPYSFDEVQSKASFHSVSLSCQ